MKINPYPAKVGNMVSS